MGSYCPKCFATVTGHYPVCVVCDAVLGDPASVAPIAPWVPPSPPAQRARAWAIALVLTLFTLGLTFGILRVSMVPGNQGPTAHLPPKKAVFIGAKGLGVDIYPGATLNDRAARKTPGNAAATVTYATRDSFDTVLDFYETRLGSPASQTERSAVFVSTSEDRKSSLMLTISEEPGGGAKIGFLHSTTR